MVHRSLLVGSNFSSIQKRKTRKTIRHLSVYKLTSLHYPQTRNLLALLLDMNNSSPNWGDMSGTKTSDIWESSNHSDMSLLPDSGVSDIPNSWFQRSTSTFSSACEGDNIQDIFKVLSDVELPTQGNSSMETIIKFLSEPEEVGRKRKAGEKDIPKCLSSETAGVSTETKGKQDVQHKRIRSAEEHNKSERMRRDRINVKLRALQELIPNCNKSDRASMLDDAIEYVKAMKLQVHMMSMGGSALCQVPYISPTSIQTVQVPGFSPLLQMKPGLGFSMGMTGMGYNPSFPLASPSASSEFPVMSFSGDPSAPQFQVPFFPSQQLPVNAAMHAMQPRINPIFCHPNQGQGEPVSRNIPRMTATHLPQAPLIPQNSDSSRHPSPLTHGTTTSLRRRRGRSH